LKPSHAKLRSTIHVSPPTLKARCLRLKIRSSQPSRRSWPASLRLSWRARAAAVRRVIWNQRQGRKRSPLPPDWRSGCCRLRPFTRLCPWKPRTPPFAGFHRLAVHNPECRPWLTAGRRACLRIQRSMQPGPNTRHSPAPEIAMHRRPRREVRWQLPPLAAGPTISSLGAIRWWAGITRRLHCESGYPGRTEIAPHRERVAASKGRSALHSFTWWGWLRRSPRTLASGSEERRRERIYKLSGGN
jgi:hypothetical protein